MKNNVIALVLTLLCAPALAQNTSGGLVTVNGVKISASQLNDWVANALSEGAQDSEQLRQAALNDLILREAIMQDAKKSGLASAPNNAFKLKIAQQNVLIEMWFANYLTAHPITDQDIKAEYEKQVLFSKDPKNARQYQISQIVVEREDEAQQLRSKINGSAGFEALAREKSADKATAVNGGLVGWVFPSQLAAPANEIVPKLSKGETSKPIQIGSAWYLIKIDDSKPFVMPDFEQAKPTIIQGLAQQRRQQAAKALLDSAKITKN